MVFWFSSPVFCEEDHENFFSLKRNFHDFLRGSTLKNLRAATLKNLSSSSQLQLSGLSSALRFFFFLSSRAELSAPELSAPAPAFKKNLSSQLQLSKISGLQLSKISGLQLSKISAPAPAPALRAELQLSGLSSALSSSSSSQLSGLSSSSQG